MTDQLKFMFGDRVDRPLLLMSLRARWHEDILAGRKRYEFRRQYVPYATTTFVYVSEPIRAVCAVATMGVPKIGRPNEIASLAASPTAEAALRSYFGDRSRVYAIPIESYRAFSPVGLDELRRLRPSFQPPQSYLFLGRMPELERLLTDRAGVV